MSEADKETSREEVLAAQIEVVRNFGPEDILSPEKRKHITDTITKALDLFASEIKSMAVETGLSREELTQMIEWFMPDFARSVLTYPLPPQATAFEAPFELEESTLEAEVADEHDWWEELLLPQKDALWRIVKEDFGIDLKNGEKLPADIPGEGYSIIKSTETIVVPGTEEWPENHFQPAVVLDPQGEPYYLTCFVVK